jgi:hypothetical protein
MREPGLELFSGSPVPWYAIETWNKNEDILEERSITNNTCDGFNSSWVGTMNKRASLFVVLEGFLNKESWSQEILREYSMVVGSNKMEGIYKPL